jgi:hypothetical protein
MLLVGGWLHWPGDCSWSRLTAFQLGRLLGVLLFTEARSMGRAAQWSRMKPECWSDWFPLKSSPTCSYRWLHCDLRDVLTCRSDLANCSVFYVYFCWSSQSQSQSYFTTDGQSVSMSWCRAHLWGPWPDFTFSFLFSEDVVRRTKYRNRSQQFLCYYDCWLPWQFCLSSCCFDTGLVTCGSSHRRLPQVQELFL